MNHIFKKVSISLLILGGAFYVMTGAESITALIPAFLGGIVGGLTLLSDRFPNQSRHFAHINLFILAFFDAFKTLYVPITLDLKYASGF